MEVTPAGKIIFAGWGNVNVTEVNGGNTARDGGNNNDGLIGQLSGDGITMEYFDEIGGSGNDRIFDIEVYADTLYFTGSVGTGFPTGTGNRYDASYNGGQDAIIGKIATNGNGYKATFYGGTNPELGNGIKQVTTTTCTGASSTFLLVWGTVTGSGLPVKILARIHFIKLQLGVDQTCFSALQVT